MNQTDIFKPAMPEVDVRPNLNAIFNRARAAASQSGTGADDAATRQMIIVTPGRLLVAKDCPPARDIPVEQLPQEGELFDRTP